MSLDLANGAEAAPTPIRFLWRGVLQQVSGLASTTTVLEWLRGPGRATGTKEGCAEGDCGACTVLLGQLDPQAPGGVALRAINSCIQLLAMIDGKALLTVEDLTGADGSLHPVQQAMVDCHGSQCGFCTPGFVVSLADLYERQDTPPPRSEICHAIAGNLCRCTGYRPILEAAERAYGMPRQVIDRAPLRQALEQLAVRPPLSYRAPAEAGGGRIDAPQDLDGLARLLIQSPSARVLAGATDIGLWITKQGRSLPHLVHLDRVADLHGIREVDGVLSLGAAVTLSEAWPRLVDRIPALAELARRFAAPTVCNSGTLGGNIANGSPIGDSMPPLLVLDARLLLQRGDAVREVELDQFYLSYMRNVLEPGEFLREIRIPLPGPGARLACYKVSKRYDQDISALCAAFRIELVGGRIADCRVAFGGMAATAKRAKACEQALLGQPFDAQTLRSAVTALAADFQPLDDLRATAAYRRTVARNLLQRFWLEQDADGRPLTVHALEVPT